MFEFKQSFCIIFELRRQESEPAPHDDRTRDEEDFNDDDEDLPRLESSYAEHGDLVPRE